MCNISIPFRADAQGGGVLPSFRASSQGVIPPLTPLPLNTCLIVELVSCAILSYLSIELYHLLYCRNLQCQQQRGMANLKIIGMRLKSVRNIQKITQSMKMVWVFLWLDPMHLHNRINIIVRINILFSDEAVVIIAFYQFSEWDGMINYMMPIALDIVCYHAIITYSFHASQLSQSPLYFYICT